MVARHHPGEKRQNRSIFVERFLATEEHAFGIIWVRGRLGLCSEVSRRAATLGSQGCFDCAPDGGDPVPDPDYSPLNRIKRPVLWIRASAAAPPHSPYYPAPASFIPGHGRPVHSPDSVCLQPSSCMPAQAPTATCSPRASYTEDELAQVLSTQGKIVTVIDQLGQPRCNIRILEIFACHRDRYEWPGTTHQQPLVGHLPVPTSVLASGLPPN